MASFGLPTSFSLWLACPLIISFLAISFFRRQISNLPPSPPADPIIGHARLIPLEYQWQTFASWSKKFGEIIYAHVPGRRMIILNSFTVARDILSQNIHSGRPRLIGQEYMGWSLTLALLPYGERWRKQRRITLKFFGNEGLRSFRAGFQDELVLFHKGIWKSPNELHEHITRLVSGTIAMVTYGHQTAEKNDHIIGLNERAAYLSTSLGSPGATTVDFFPILKYIPAWIPGIRIKKHLIAGKRAREEAFMVPYEKVKQERRIGAAKPSFIKDLIDDYEAMGIEDIEHEEDMIALGGMVFAAGSDTSAAVLDTFFLLMTLHPDVAKRAQEEIDKVLGYGSRLPTLDDRDVLPYVDCILKETYRINSPLPLGVAHQCIEPAIYNGYDIPKGSMLVPNIWLMMRDEAIFPEPEVFRPERYHAQASGAHRIPDEANPGRVVFGFGKRVCPGRLFADQVIWLTIATVLTLCDILPVTDKKTGMPMFPALEFTSGFTIHPKPYKCRIVPRDKKHEALIHLQ